MKPRCTDEAEVSRKQAGEALKVMLAARAKPKRLGVGPERGGTSMKGDGHCVPGKYMCGNCRRKLQAQAFRRLTPEERAYDNYVDPSHAYHDDYPRNCSCHISAPCSVCTGEADDD